MNRSNLKTIYFLSFLITVCILFNSCEKDEFAGSWVIKSCSSYEGECLFDISINTLYIKNDGSCYLPSWKSYGYEEQGWERVHKDSVKLKCDGFFNRTYHFGFSKDEKLIKGKLTSDSLTLNVTKVLVFKNS